MVTRLTIANSPCIPTSVAGWLAAVLACRLLTQKPLIHNEPHLHYYTNILCTATDVGMHGLLAIVNRVTILCYPLV